MDSITFKLLEDIRASNIEVLTNMLDAIEERIRTRKTNDEDRCRSLQKLLQAIDGMPSEEAGG